MTASVDKNRRRLSSCERRAAKSIQAQTGKTPALAGIARCCSFK
ncbi:Protein of unknown function [Pyronema omphalodes CBS 100304]|uniref:Uncharacterized protein n=1 Tax=Pyronema omphalodes (strain CBS 100304) TaxID=1076935 RepID=U4L2B8_PYROM|nr:Protein of unknown function [Pyronema omphalodes CBS 100304]